MAAKSNRRQFITGEAVVNAAQAASQARAEQGEPLIELPVTKLLTVRREAMACQWEVMLNAGQYDQETKAAVEALDLVGDLEQQLTVYRPDSELSQVNRLAHHHPMQVEENLFALLQRGQQVFEQTDGAFDMTSGPLSKLWGFYRRQGKIPDQEALEITRERVGGQWVKLDETAQTVHFQKQGLELNLGGIGKGYAVDEACDLLLQRGIEDFLLHGGCSSVRAAGLRFQGPTERVGWPISIKHPLNPQQTLAEVWLKERALGTSGAGHQFFRHQGKKYGHILDPRTGWPAEGTLSVTVCAPNAEQADCLATAFFVMGREKIEQYAQHHPELSILVVERGRGGLEVKCTLLNWPEDEIRLR